MFVCVGSKPFLTCLRQFFLCISGFQLSILLLKLDHLSTCYSLLLSKLEESTQGMEVLTWREVDHGLRATLRSLSKVDFLPSWLKRSPEGLNPHREDRKITESQVDGWIFRFRSGRGVSIISEWPLVLYRVFIFWASNKLFQQLTVQVKKSNQVSREFSCQTYLFHGRLFFLAAGTAPQIATAQAFRTDVELKAITQFDDIRRPSSPVERRQLLLLHNRLKNERKSKQNIPEFFFQIRLIMIFNSFFIVIHFNFDFCFCQFASQFTIIKFHFEDFFLIRNLCENFCLLIAKWPYTFGHDDLEGKRASCLMNTHCNTVWNNRHHRALSLWQFQFHFKIHLSRSGVPVPVKAIFCDVTPMTTHFNQSIKLFKKYSPLIDRWRKLRRGKKPKKWFWLGFRTPDLETWGLKGNWNCHGVVDCSAPRCRGKEEKRPLTTHCFTQCYNGCSLGSLLFPRQDNHVQKCNIMELTKLDSFL